ncbi:hypothetical protein SADUNF_Sadunf05G0152700 [Salix dunnii]|uniref:Trichome birefringence-like C-terminal domain-containing protein n=1 Tax=Salix dunnii TaxID=1413687 RepID=A0A835MXT9_9ROSI|nr:hypothetical protein SADUNF_Sadunf05G0152700 [Salix dunnii]
MLSTKLRWQPKNCNLPRKAEELKACFCWRLHWKEPMGVILYILTAAVPDNSSICEVNGSLINYKAQWVSIKYYNCTVEYYRTPFLMILDRPLQKLRISYFQLLASLNLENPILGHNNYPLLFSITGGDRKSHGSCNLEKLPDLVLDLPEVRFKIFFDVLSKNSNESQAMNLHLLNVTSKSARRKDGHPSVYYLGPSRGPPSLHRQDCSHWCLPGVPDSWNELLYTPLLKRESVHAQNLTESSQAPL